MHILDIKVGRPIKRTEDLTTMDDKKVLENTKRVVTNTLILLNNEGLFNGKQAVPILEATQFLQGILKDIESRITASDIILPNSAQTQAVEATKTLEIAK